jgi:DUF971 family protein
MNNSLSTPELVSLRRDYLTLRWAEGDHVVTSAAALRAACRCAECRSSPDVTAVEDHSTVKLTGVTPVGQYALQLTFSDGHDRGIYPWSLLHELGP